MLFALMTGMNISLNEMMEINSNRQLPAGPSLKQSGNSGVDRLMFDSLLNGFNARPLKRQENYTNNNNSKSENIGRRQDHSEVKTGISNKRKDHGHEVTAKQKNTENRAGINDAERNRRADDISEKSEAKRDVDESNFKRQKAQQEADADKKAVDVKKNKDEKSLSELNDEVSTKQKDAEKETVSENNNVLMNLLEDIVKKDLRMEGVEDGDTSDEECPQETTQNKVSEGNGNNESADTEKTIKKALAKAAEHQEAKAADTEAGEASSVDRATEKMVDTDNRTDKEQKIQKSTEEAKADAEAENIKAEFDMKKGSIEDKADESLNREQPDIDKSDSKEINDEDLLFSGKRKSSRDDLIKEEGAVDRNRTARSEKVRTTDDHNENPGSRENERISTEAEEDPADFNAESDSNDQDNENLSKADQHRDIKRNDDAENNIMEEIQSHNDPDEVNENIDNRTAQNRFMTDAAENTKRETASVNHNESGSGQTKAGKDNADFGFHNNAGPGQAAGKAQAGGKDHMARMTGFNDLVDKIVYTVKGENRLGVSVKHEELGNLNIRLTLEKGMVNIHIHTPDKVMREFVESNVQQIINSIEKSGVSVGGFSVALKNNGGRQGHEGGRRNTFFNGKGPKNEYMKIPEYTAGSGKGLVNIFA